MSQFGGRVWTVRSKIIMHGGQLVIISHSDNNTDTNEIQRPSCMQKKTRLIETCLNHEFTLISLKGSPISISEKISMHNQLLPLATMTQHMQQLTLSYTTVIAS